jgi:hypothetical protein
MAPRPLRAAVGHSAGRRPRPRLDQSAPVRGLRFKVGRFQNDRLTADELAVDVCEAFSSPPRRSAQPVAGLGVKPVALRTVGASAEPRRAARSQFRLGEREYFVASPPRAHRSWRAHYRSHTVARTLSLAHCRSHTVARTLSLAHCRSHTVARTLSLAHCRSHTGCAGRTSPEYSDVRFLRRMSRCWRVNSC